MISEKDLTRIIANHTSDYLSIVDTNYVYLAVNKAYTEGFSMKSEDIVGKPIHNLIGADKFNNVIKPNFDKCIKEGKVTRFEEWFDLPTGRRFFSVSYTPVLTDCCKQVIVASVHDNTQHKLTEDSLAEAVTELKQIDDFKNKLFSIISHDIKSPLGAISSFLKLLNEEEDNLEKLKSIIPLMENSLEKTNEMVDDLLNWAGSQIKGKKISYETFRLATVFDEVMDLFQERIEAKKLTVKNKLPSDLKIKADRDGISHVIRNLMTNAIKFSNEKGQISMEVKEVDLHKTTFIFKDDGIGMSKKQANMLF